MLALLGAVAVSASSYPPPKQLPRITVRSGQFVEAVSGKPFHPRGFNYIRLRTAGSGDQKFLWHDTLNPATYSSARTEAMFADLERRGFTLVRIFLDHMTGAGFVAEAGAEGLSPAYMRNLLDFLERARAHRVYVIPCFCYLPDVAGYRGGAPPENVAGMNRPYLDPGYMRGKARYMADVCAAIKKHDPSLLSTVFAYELENESHFMATEPPFSLTSGTIHWQGKTYDASRPEELQRLADDGIIAAVNAAAEAVKKVDRQAMVGASVFTFQAVGRTGPARLRDDKTPDGRFPARPLAIARSKSAYVDIHFYPMSETSLDGDYRSIEFPELRDACRKAGKPMIVGEIGCFRHVYKDVPTAAEGMRKSLARLQRDGFAGFLYWTYDNDEQSDHLWHALAGKGEIIAELEQAMR